jgi:hypothetical protein
MVSPVAPARCWDFREIESIEIGQSTSSEENKLCAEEISDSDQKEEEKMKQSRNFTLLLRGSVEREESKSIREVSSHHFLSFSSHWSYRSQLYSLKTPTV